MFQIRRIFLLLLFLFPSQLLAACATSSPSSSVALPENFQGFFGRVYSASDVSGIPDTPLKNQLILAIPIGAAPDLLALDFPLDPARLRFLRHTLPAPDPRVEVTASGEDGTYTLQLPPGDYLICLGDSQHPTERYPLDLRGCGSATLPTGEAREVNISSGYGEILLEPAP
jgi:hypothetical protein